MSYDNWKTTDRLSCGCEGVCDPYAHDTAPDWDGTPDGPDWDDLSPREQAEYLATQDEEFSARYQNEERNR